MKHSSLHRVILAAVIAAMASAATAADVIGDVMKKYHKAPQGTDPVCKKASNGTASAAELAELLQAYQTIAKESPPKGDAESWKSKTGALIAGVSKLQKDPKDASAYKQAVSCKACHTVHKPD